MRLQLAGPLAALGDCFVRFFHFLRIAARIEQIGDDRAKHILGPPAIEPLGAFVPVGQAALEIGDDDRVLSLGGSEACSRSVAGALVSSSNRMPP